MALGKGGLFVDELFFDEAGEAWGFRGGGFASGDLLFGVGDAVVASEVIDATVFGAEDEFGDAITVKVGDGRTGIVAGNIAIGDVAYLFKDDLTVALSDVSVPESVLRIDEQVESAVTIPVHLCDLGASAATGAAGVQLHGVEVFVDEDAFGFAAAAAEGKVAFLIHHDEIKFSVGVIVEGEWGRAPLGEGVARG